MTIKKNKGLSLHVRSDDGKHLNGRISLAGSDIQDIPTPALSLSGGNVASRNSFDVSDFPSTELSNSVSQAAEIYQSTLANTEGVVSEVPLRIDYIQHDAEGHKLLAHLRRYHSASEIPFLPADGSSDSLDRQALEDFHNTTHANEISTILASQTEGQIGNTQTAHYHARDLSNNPNVEWAEASELLRYAAAHNEMDNEEKYLSEDEGKELIFARKLAEAKASGLYDAIKAFGVTEPILIVSPEDGADEGYPEGYIYDGYHRLAVAVDINYKMLIPYSWA